MVVARLRRDAKVGAEERRAELGDKLLGGIARIAPSLAPEFAGKSRRMPRPMTVMPISA